MCSLYAQLFLFYHCGAQHQCNGKICVIVWYLTLTQIWSCFGAAMVLLR